MESITKRELPPANLTHNETRSLIRVAQKGDKLARDKLIQANLRLVMSLVQRYSGRGYDQDDLFQVGCIGLVHAIEHFDLSYEVRFSTYAVPRILGEIRRYIQQDRTVKVGRHWHDLAINAARTRDTLEQEIGRSPTISELASRLGVAREEVVAALESAAQPASMDELINKDESDPWRISDLFGVESHAGIIEDNIALQQVMATLSEEEQLLVKMRFFQEMRQTDVAQSLGVSQAHISRLERRVLFKMRNLLI